MQPGARVAGGVVDESLDVRKEFAIGTEDHRRCVDHLCSQRKRRKYRGARKHDGIEQLSCQHENTVPCEGSPEWREPIGDAMLERLARFRARAIAETLIGQGLAEARIAVGDRPAPAAAGTHHVLVPIELDAGPAASR
jgi:hypothetical protein